MKKIIYILLAVAAVFASCSKSEVTSAPGADSPIVFNPYLGKTPVTKAPVATTDTLGAYGFQVYAFIHTPLDGNTATEKNFAGDPYLDKVVAYDEDGEWGYEGTAYWPTSYYLDFVAYGLNSKGLENSPYLTEAADHKSVTYTVPTAILEQKDLVVANPEINEHHANSNKTIALQFNHMLSRIAFSLVTKDNNAVPVTISELKLNGNFYSKGTVNLTAASPVITPDTETPATTGYDVLAGGTFTHIANATGVNVYNNGMLYELNGVTGEAGQEDYSEASYDLIYAPENTELTDEEAADKAAREAQAKKNSESQYLMIIPSDNPATEAVETVEASVDITYFLPGAGYYSMNVPLKKTTGEYIQFEARKAYNFKFKVSTNGISFSVDVDGWDASAESVSFNLL